MIICNKCERENTSACKHCRYMASSHQSNNEFKAKGEANADNKNRAKRTE